MPTAWGGADPIQFFDAADYELAVEYVANQDVTITHIRVWAGAPEVNMAGRKARIWTTGGTQLGIATLPDDLPTGWSQHALDVPVERPAGQHWVVSWSTGGNYGALVGALDSPVSSADGAVTAVAGPFGAHGNGSSNLTPGLFPATASSNNAFYGADCVYTLGLPGHTPPQIESVHATVVDPVVAVTIAATDVETLVGATYRYDWGDGSPVTTSGTPAAQHTYTSTGTYAVLVSVTDTDGLSDYAAVAVHVDVPALGVGFAPQPPVGLVAGRAAARRLMTDECTITRLAGARAWDPNTGTYTQDTTLVYAGPCRIVPAALEDRRVVSGEEAVSLWRYVVSVPHTVLAELGDTITVTASAADPSLRGRVLRVRQVTRGSQVTSHRLGCEEQEAP